MRILLVVYDNSSYSNFFPLNIGYIAAVLVQAGHQVEIFNQDTEHHPDALLTAHLDAHPYDVLGIGVIGGYYQYKKLLTLAQAVNASRNRPFFVLGGHGPTPDPGHFLQKTRADAVVMGEGEITVVELVRALEEKTPLSQVKGIAFVENDRLTITPGRALIENLDEIPLPAYHLFPMRIYRLVKGPNSRDTDFTIPVLSSRGCNFTCSFCYRMDKGYRLRAVDAVLEEIRHLQRDYGISYVFFQDELLMSSMKRTTELCEAILRQGLQFRWCANGRLNFARPELLALMKRAGCVFINYGIEAMDDQVLKRMNKALTTRQIVRGIEATLASGISPGFNIIFGNPGDSRESLQKGVEFLLRYDDHAQCRTIRPVTPYPGSPLYYEAIQRGLLKDCADFYENKHTNSDLLSVNMTDLSDAEFYDGLYEANLQLLEAYNRHVHASSLRQLDLLYKQKDSSFRGFRRI
ncbi:MAG: B12-binding domain-containing radical SAM protein [Magnetococcales bacterium]|nr:B12-binding domain-containing radical SAM protein [Magnetococcales bacterium]